MHALQKELSSLLCLSNFPKANLLEINDFDFAIGSVLL